VGFRLIVHHETPVAFFFILGMFNGTSLVLFFFGAVSKTKPRSCFVSVRAVFEAFCLSPLSFVSVLCGVLLFIAVGCCHFSFVPSRLFPTHLRGFTVITVVFGLCMVVFLAFSLRKFLVLKQPT